MNILAWVILGLLTGAIAKAIYPGYQGGGILSTMLLGIVGAFIVWKEVYRQAFTRCNNAFKLL